VIKAQRAKALGLVRPRKVRRREGCIYLPEEREFIGGTAEGRGWRSKKALKRTEKRGKENSSLASSPGRPATFRKISKEDRVIGARKKASSITATPSGRKDSEYSNGRTSEGRPKTKKELHF